MASGRKILSRIKSAKNISQITKAMQMVSASKMKKSQDQATRGEPYSVELRRILLSLLSNAKSIDHELLNLNETAAKDLCVFVTTNKGLCGGLNTNHFRAIHLWHKKNPQTDFVSIGKKGRGFAIAMGAKVVADFSELPEKLDFADTLPISHFIIDLFKNQQYRRIYFSYNKFISTLAQKPKRVQLLPIEASELKESIGLLEELTAEEKSKFEPKEYLFEPNANQIITWLLPYYIELQTYHFLLENKASEHSARMVAMKGASENAQEVMKELRKVFNRLRQQQVTSEIADIVTASMSVQ
jgi:F-type H+-transporting ATPase subunit gamma